MDYHDLKKMKVTELQTLAKEKAGVAVVADKSKEQLVDIIAEAMGIPKPHRVVEGVDKTAVKEKIRQLKQDRSEALEARDRERLRRIRRHIRGLKRRLRRNARLTH